MGFQRHHVCAGACRALLHYYFAAAGNDTFAQMALGYRHAHGLGVPQSCTAAVLYYNPVAEQVIELARHPSSLPEVGSPSQGHVSSVWNPE